MADVHYFNEGYLTLNSAVVTKLTDISLSLQVDSDEYTNFDTDYFKEYNTTYKGWTASASVIVSTGTTEPTKYSAITAISGVTNSQSLFDYALARTELTMVVKLLNGLFYHGKVFINSAEFTGSVGSKLTMSVQLQGTGSLTKASSHP